jgi:hypothetical protein
VLPASIGRRDLIRDSPDTDFRRGMIRHSRALRKAPRARRRPGGRAERRSDARTLRPGGFQPFSGDHRTQLSRRVVDPDPHGTGLCDRDLGEPEGIFKFSVSEQAPSEVILAPWNSSLIRRSKSTREGSAVASPIGCATIAYRLSSQPTDRISKME